jgi:hypothetical protein
MLVFVKRCSATILDGLPNKMGDTSTAGATIDVVARIIKLNISGKEETFTFKPKGTEQCNRSWSRPDCRGML